MRVQMLSGSMLHFCFPTLTPTLRMCGYSMSLLLVSGNVNVRLRADFYGLMLMRSFFKICEMAVYRLTQAHFPGGW
jgi:hypothetical protein